MYPKETEDAICARLAEGESLRSICRDEGMPDFATVKRWLLTREDFRAQYAQAREIGDDAEFEDLATLADEKPALTQTGSVDPGWVAWQRNRIDVRKWSLARKQPRKYGEVANVNLGGTLNLRATEWAVVEPEQGS